MGGKIRRPLEGHQKIGKRFVPPMAQWHFGEARWSEWLVPEFLWLALLHERWTYSGGAEIARVTAEAARSINGVTKWCAPMSSYVSIAAESRTAFIGKLEQLGVKHELVTGLAPLHADYPNHPLAFVFNEPARRDREYMKNLIARLISKRGDVDAMRAQSTALYLALDAKCFFFESGSGLADFPEVQHYPNTEKSLRVGSLVRASLNALTVMIDECEWPRYFWNRGLQLEACEIAADDDE